MSSPAALANHLTLASRSPAERFAAFNPAQPSGLLRERWKYSRLSTFADAYSTAHEQNAFEASFDKPDAVATTISNAGDSSSLSGAALTDSYQWQAYPLADGIVSTGPGWLAQVAVGSQVAGKLTVGDGQGHALIRIGESASADLTLDLRSRKAAFALLQVEIGANAALTLDTMALDTEGLSWLLSRFTLHDHARLTVRQYFAGSGTHRHETHVVVAGSGSEVDLTGAAIGHPGSRLDQQLVMEHAAPHSISQQRYHCVGLAGSKSNFSGRIHIHPGAKQTVAQLNNRNLALASDAELNTKPELEIYNDDVRCAHGATVGQLDEDALYYCQSRGIAPARARALLTAGFLQQCVAGPNAEQVAETIRRRIA
ncbi:MAG: SufD family Fe-S cluster assembly protein [Pseudomonadales bacterium]